MVRNDVQHLPEASATQLTNHVRVARRAAQLGVEALWIDDVIAVCTAGGRLKVRRAIQMRNPKHREVVSERGRAAMSRPPTGGRRW